MSGSIVKNSLLNAVSGLTFLVVGFVSSIVVARLLGPEANGTIAYSLWLVTTASLIAELGTGLALQRNLSRLSARGYDADARRGFAAWLLLPVVAATLATTAGYYVFVRYGGEMEWTNSVPHVAMLTGVLFIIQSIGSFSKNYLIGDQRLPTFLKLSLGSALVQMPMVILGAYFYGIAGALTGYIGGQVVLFAYSLRILTTRPDKCGVSAKELVSSSAIIVVEYIVTAIFLNRFEFFFIQSSQGVEAVGYYAVALSLANLAMQLPIQLTGSLVPFYAHHLERNDGVLPAGIFETVIRNFAYLTLPMSFGLAAIAEPLVTTVYGQPFHNAGVMVSILALGIPGVILLQLITQYVLANDWPVIRLKTAILGAILLTAGSFALTPVWGGEGAAAIRGVAFAVMCIYMFHAAKLPFSTRAMFAPVLKILAASITMGALAWLIAKEVQGIAGVILAIAAGVVVYLPALRIFHAVPVEDRAMLRSLLERLPQKLRPLGTAIVEFITPRGARSAREA